MNYVDTSRPPVQPARKAAHYSAPLMQTERSIISALAVVSRSLSGWSPR